MTRRREDAALLTGHARFVADVAGADALHAAFVRSPVAHGRISDLDVSVARRLATVCTADDLDLPDQPADPGLDATLGRPLLARDVVRFAGEPVAVVAAADPHAAADAAAACVASFEPLPAVTDPMAAMADDAPLVFGDRGSNIVRTIDTGYDAVDLSGSAVGLDAERVRLVLPDVGGGFGGKLPTYPEHTIVAALALRLGVPVRYSETRSENLVAMIHGRGQVQDVEVGAMRDGTLVGLRAHIVLDAGAYPAMLDRASLTTSMLCGAYRIPQAGATVTCVATNAPPTRAYRGVGRVEATALVERSVDLVAAELRMDPLDVRRRNMIPADVYPYNTPTGARYDSGDVPSALKAATTRVGYHDLRREQRHRRAHDIAPHLGIGIGAYVSLTGWDPEYAAVEITDAGRACVAVGTAASGQGHATTWVRLVHDVLGIDAAHVAVAPLDTATVPRGMGSWGSRSLQTAGNAVALASRAVRDRAVPIAAAHWGIGAEAVGIGPGGATCGTSRLSWARLAQLADDQPLRAEVNYEQRHLTAPFGVHVAVVELDADTGRIRVVRYVAVDDCGRVCAPAIVDGQIHGGIAQGIGEALYEDLRHAPDGTPLTATLRSYKIPGAPDVPAIDVVRSQVPAPGNPLGAKGVGESGVIGAVAAVRNAAVDAVAHLGVRHIDVPLTPERVWRALCV